MTNVVSIAQSGANNVTMRNRLINGGMVIDQRGSASTPVTTAAYATDRWSQGSPVVSKISTQQSTTTTTGFSNSLASTVSSAYTPAAGEVFRIYQRIEGNNCADLAFGSASAATVTLSFWVRSSVTGTYAVSLQNSANTRSYVSTYTVNSANTFEFKTITIAGDTSGTWLTTNGIGIQVAFCQQTGSTFQTTAGSWQAGEYYGVAGAASWLPTSGATFYITGVQLEKGSTATPFEQRLYGTELALCQRYYYRIIAGTAGQIFGNGYNTSTSAAFVLTPFKVPMRTAPTALEQSGTAGDYRVNNLATATTCTSVPALYVATTENVATTFTTGATLTAGQGSFGSSVNTTAYLGWSAEL